VIRHIRRVHEGFSIVSLSVRYVAAPIPLPTIEIM